MLGEVSENVTQPICSNNVENGDKRLVCGGQILTVLTRHPKLPYGIIGYHTINQWNK